MGGILAGGLSNIDNHNQAVIGGLYQEFRRRIVDHYAKTYGADSAQVKACREGRDFEPRVAEAIFNEMLAAEKNITVKLQHRLRGVHRDGKRLRRIVMVNLVDRMSVIQVEAGVFIDATYEGDLAAMAARKKGSRPESGISPHGSPTTRATAREQRGEASALPLTRHRRIHSMQE